MSSHVYHYHRMKPEFLPASLQLCGIYIKPGQMPQHINHEEWQLGLPCWHPNALIIADVELRGYCVRELETGIDAGKFYSH